MQSAPKANGIFVTGTDTGVGKTLVSCALLRILRARGADAVGFKPVASGVTPEGWEDANALAVASDGCEPLENICPLRLREPLAPTLAARAEGGPLDLQRARATLAGLRSRHRTVVVEGIGGLLVPLDDKTLVLDFAAETRLPLLLVCRAGLGTINHTLLTIREIERAGLPLSGIIMNITRREDASLAAGARGEIERLGGKKVLAVLEWLGGERPQAAEAAAALAAQLNVEELLAAAGS